MPRCLAAALFAAIVLAAATPPASAASFDCGRAFTALEKAVCQDPRLGDLDARMARNYITLLNRISDSSATAIRADQKTWLKKRDACGDDTRCINREYRARIKKIGQLSATVDRALEKAGLPAFHRQGADDRALHRRADPHHRAAGGFARNGPHHGAANHDFHR